MGLLVLGTLDVKDAMVWKKRLNGFRGRYCMFNEPLSRIVMVIIFNFSIVKSLILSSIITPILVPVCRRNVWQTSDVINDVIHSNCVCPGRGPKDKKVEHEILYYYCRLDTAGLRIY